MIIIVFKDLFFIKICKIYLILFFKILWFLTYIIYILIILSCSKSDLILCWGLFLTKINISAEITWFYFTGALISYLWCWIALNRYFRLTNIFRSKNRWAVDSINNLVPKFTLNRSCRLNNIFCWNILLGSWWG